jgi:hypothetical protein
VDCTVALDQVRAKLEATFGKALTMMILASASNTTGVSTVLLTPPEFTRLADAICKDQRVVDMWGTLGAGEIAQQWRSLVS